MDNLRSCIDILYRKISPCMIIDSIYMQHGHRITCTEIDENIFINEGLHEFSQYSEDEIRNIYQCVINVVSGRDNARPSSKLYLNSIFNLLLEFVIPVLTEKENEPCCKYEHFLKWRVLSHKLGQDIFTTSLLAYKDTMSLNSRTNFSWNQVIKSDNNRLKRMLSNGLAENHFHLKGSSPAFDLSWICLMNDIQNRKVDFINAGISKKRLDPDMDYGSEYPKINLYYLTKKAALIRAFLFESEKNICIFGKDKNEEQIKIKNYLLNDYILEYKTPEIQRSINILKMNFGMSFSSKPSINRSALDYGNMLTLVRSTMPPSTNSFVLDYAIPKRNIQYLYDENIIFSGERNFMYSIFKKIFSKEYANTIYPDLFYTYLVIKSKLRSELIQINDRVGFKNFSDYQDRKEIFYERNPVMQDIMYETAISSTINNQNIKSLEARITPKNTPYKISNQIQKIDSILNGKMDTRDSYYYFVLHFTKSKEKNKKTDMIISSRQPRNYKKRNEVKEQAQAIAALRNSLYESADRILGIDACSNEIGCRPEVFAQAFRYLKSSTVNNNLLSKKYIPQLGATYHAGEDFLDIVDGLRAIDEVIEFLNFKHGDRIGHGLALGINADDWYKKKNYRLIMPKQDYIDNIVWMLAKIREFNLCCNESFILELENVYEKLFYDIYIASFPEDKTTINYSFQNYYDSWKLRGDNPKYYSDGCFHHNTCICSWDMHALNNFALNDNTKYLEYLRENENISYLYYNYHFNPRVKKIGQQQIEVVISNRYINIVKDIQTNMMKLVANRGIGIETNPSSNYLIGTFKRYDEHPIIKFYNLGLVHDSSKLKECPQIPVSVNTDDQGVFDTYLENEYALLAISLEKAKDENGNQLYNQSMIYDWLEKIRQMGLQQSFCVSLSKKVDN